MTSIETESSLQLSQYRGRRLKRTASAALTKEAIKAMKAPQVRADGWLAPGAGRLKVRKRKTGRGVVTEWLFIWHSHGSAPAAAGSEKRLATITLGKYSEQPRADHLTLEQARKRASELQEQVRAGVDPGMAREARQHEARKEQSANVQRLRESQRKTLQAMLDAYVTHLEERGKKTSAYDAKNMFSNHVTAPFPEAAAMPAADVTAEHISEILTRLVRPPAGGKPKGRTALKLRAYMGAAFKLALGASRDPMAPSAAAGFGLTTNAAAAVPSESMARAFNRAGTRVLSAAELRVYIRRLDDVPSMVNRLALQMHLLSGGQRLQQLLRLTRGDIGEATFTLFDSKGRRSQARPHILPLVPDVAEVVALLLMLSALAEGGPVDTLFAGRGGAVVNPETLSGEVASISEAMVEAGEAVQPFRLGDIRRTCETMMAEVLSISKDTRAQLLSHGISGVQAVHYNKGEHLEAKTMALLAWCEYLAAVRAGGRACALSSKVVPIKKMVA